MKNPGPWSEAEPTYSAQRPSTQYWAADYNVGGSRATQVYGSSYRAMARSGYRTPGYFTMLQNGQPVPPAPATLSKEVMRFTAPLTLSERQQNLPAGQYYWADYTVWYDPTKNYYNGTLESVGAALHSSTELSLARSNAMRRFRSDVRQTAFESLTFAGELGESVRMIADRSQRLSKGIISTYSGGVLRKTNWFDSFKRSQSKFLSGRQVSKQEIQRWLHGKSQYWLESCYGWRPLLSDIDAAAKAAADYVVKGTDYTGVRGSDESEREAHWRVTVSFFGRQGFATLHRADKQVLRYGAMRSVSYRNASSLEHALRHIGVSWDQVVPTIWNLIPYSFVVDALTNSADVIDALTCPMGGINYPWYVSMRETVIDAVVYPDFKLSGLNPKYWVWTSQQPGSCTRTRIEWSRGPSGAVFDVPDLEIRRPSVSSVVNLAALSVSKLTSVTKAWHRGIYP